MVVDLMFVIPHTCSLKRPWAFFTVSFKHLLHTGTSFVVSLNAAALHGSNAQQCAPVATSHQSPISMLIAAQELACLSVAAVCLSHKGAVLKIWGLGFCWTVLFGRFHRFSLQS